MPTITITLKAHGSKLIEEVAYASNVEKVSRRNWLGVRRRAAEQDVANGRRKKTYKLPHENHHHSDNEPEWIVGPEETVLWQSANEFWMDVDYDLGPCDNVQDAPRSPFLDEDGEPWSGIQKSRITGSGEYPHQIVGTVVHDGSSAHEQVFYKYSAFAPGLEPLDPDGACGNDLEGG